MKLANYMDDGANWQAQAVLCYLRDLAESIESKGSYKGFSETLNREVDFNIIQEIGVTRYDNCREQGYIFFVKTWKGEQRNYAVYEHRNTDQLCILKRDFYSFNDPLSPEMWETMKNSSDTDERFSYGQIMECGEWIKKDMISFIKEKLNKKDEKNDTQGI